MERQRGLSLVLARAQGRRRGGFVSDNGRTISRLFLFFDDGTHLGTATAEADSSLKSTTANKLLLFCFAAAAAHSNFCWGNQKIHHLSSRVRNMAVNGTHVWEKNVHTRFIWSFYFKSAPLLPLHLWWREISWKEKEGFAERRRGEEEEGGASCFLATSLQRDVCGCERAPVQILHRPTLKQVVCVALFTRGNIAVISWAKTRESPGLRWSAWRSVRALRTKGIGISEIQLGADVSPINH